MVSVLGSNPQRSHYQAQFTKSSSHSDADCSGLLTKCYVLPKDAHAYRSQYKELDIPIEGEQRAVSGDQ